MNPQKVISRYLRVGGQPQLLPRIERPRKPYSAALPRWKYQNEIAKITRWIRNEVTSKHCDNCGKLRTLASFSLHKQMCSACCEKIWLIHQSIPPSDVDLRQSVGGFLCGWLAWGKRMEYAGRKCEDCGARKRLHMHHITYSTYGREHFDHVRILCASCHAKTHARLRRAAKQEALIAKAGTAITEQ